jgi:hypothetical protein
MSRFAFAFMAVYLGPCSNGSPTQTPTSQTPDWSVVAYDQHGVESNCDEWCWGSVDIDLTSWSIELLGYDDGNTMIHEAHGTVTPAGVQYLQDLITDVDAATSGGIEALEDEYDCPTDAANDPDPLYDQFITDIVFFDQANSTYKTVTFPYWRSATCTQPQLPAEMDFLGTALGFDYFHALYWGETTNLVEVN